MQFYYNPYACSLAVAIAASEAGIPLDYRFVDILKDPHRLADGTNYAAVNPKNYVPMLRLENGETLTEVAVILQYIADLGPGHDLAPANGTIERVWLQEWLNFLSSELHKFYSPWLFHPEVGEVAQAFAREKLKSRLAIVDLQLAEYAFVAGDTFSIADAYLFVMVNWSAFARVPLDGFVNILDWFERVKARPAVIDAVRHHSVQPTAIAA